MCPTNARGHFRAARALKRQSGMPASKEDVVRLVWLIVACACAALHGPTLAATSSWAIGASHSPNLLVVAILLKAIILWVGLGLLGGFLMQRQPWYRSLYVMLPMIVFALVAPGIR